jgi:hypothetical protein
VAGSSESGEEVQSGRTNRAEDRTRFWAQRPEGESFEGPAILIVEVAGDIGDDDFEKPADSQDIHGIMASGNGSGTGVIGYSRRHMNDDPQEELTALDIEHARSAGVFGKGIAGVVGQGDTTANASGGQSDIESGAGIVGRGGAGRGPAAGVVGFAGGTTLTPSVQGAGVFGVGPTGVMGWGEDGIGVEGFGGRLKPGVAGIGGAGRDRDGRDMRGPGVVGIGNNDNAAWTDEQARGTGVVGIGVDGVHGIGSRSFLGQDDQLSSGPGGRGGVFQAERNAQVRLVPEEADEAGERPRLTPFSPAAYPSLPKAGLRGDLMSVVDRSGQATLWFCVTEVEGVAQWARVGLGDLFDGTAS